MMNDEKDKEHVEGASSDASTPVVTTTAAAPVVIEPVGEYQPALQVAPDTTMIALNPGEMVTAQTGLVDWCVAKLKECLSELTTAQGLIDALRTANVSDARGRRMVTAVRKRITFYEKVKAALEAGYYVLPPFPLQAFAIRVPEGKAPSARYDTDRWNRQERANALPGGEGEYVNPFPRRVHDSTQNETNSAGQIVKRDYYINTNWKDLEFPISVVRPELVTATGNALQKRIFDLVGPATKRPDHLRSDHALQTICRAPHVLYRVVAGYQRPVML